MMEKILKGIKKIIIKKDSKIKNFNGIRGQIFFFTSLFLLILGLSTTIFNIFYSLSHHNNLEAIIYFFTFFILLIACFLKVMDSKYRIGLFILFLYTNGVINIVRWGLLSSGQIYLFLIPVLTAIFHLRSATYLFLFVNLLTFVYLKYFINIGLLTGTVLTNFTLSEWIVFATGFLIINIVLSIFLLELINMLIRKTDSEEEKIENLTEKMEKLNRVNVKFQSIIKKNKEFKEHELESQRLDSIGRLTSGIAHEFNNFITVIVGYTDILLSVSNNDEMFNKLLRKIKMAGKSAEKLVGKLLAFSKNIVMKNRIVNLNDILLSLEHDLKQIVRDNVKLKIDLPDENYLVKVDPKQIKNILKELVANSNHACPDGGNITISLSTELFNDEYARKHGLEKSGEYVILTVNDDGIGMDEETLKHIFEPFFSTKGAGESLGLGLSMIYGIIKQSKGDLDIHSKPGEGTTVKIYLFSQQEKLTFKKSDQIIPSDLKGDEHILLVEDDKLVRSVIVEVLNNYGYKITTASNGEEGLNIFLDIKDDINLIIADVVMPKMNGISLIKKAETESNKIRSLYMSGYSEQIKNLDKMGVNYIKKPFDPLELVKKIRIILDQKPIVD